MEAAINKTKEALKGTDAAAIKAATEELSKVFYPIAEKLYAQQAPQGGAPGGDMGGGAAPGGDGVVDADYEVVDDDKK